MWDMLAFVLPGMLLAAASTFVLVCAWFGFYDTYIAPVEGTP